MSCIQYLLDLSCGTLEKFNVAVSDALAVFAERLIGGVITGKQDKRVPRSTSVSLVYEQDTFFAVQYVHRCQALFEELQLHMIHITIYPTNSVSRMASVRVEEK